MTSQRDEDLIPRRIDWTSTAAGIIRLLGFLLVSWCVMVTTHEIGHIVGGVCSGGSVKDADLAPWRLPYSLFDPDPHPLVTLWAGPILGVVIPLAAAVVFRTRSIWFVADFCLLANGAYLAVAWVAGDRFLDTPRLLKHGASPVAIAAYCAVTIGIGYRRFRHDVQSIFERADSPCSNLNAPENVEVDP